jgi:uncharacterized MAPEG superfamily protein
MRPRDLRRSLRKLYPKYTTRMIDDLKSSIRSKKHWKVHGKRGDALYAVALSRAKRPFMSGFRVKTTASKTVVVEGEASRYVRKGRILVVVDRGEYLICRTVIDWPAFRKLMHQDQDGLYTLFVDRSKPPRFIDRRNLGNIIKAKEEA